MAQAELIKNLMQWFWQAGIEVAKNYIPQIWEAIQGFWNNKTLAVIGPTACGKDSLIARLKGKPVPDIHINTGMPESVESYKVHYATGDDEVISFKANKTLNVGGEEPDRDEYWGEVCQKADVVFYMLDAQKLAQSQSQTISRLNNDMRWLVSEMDGKKFPRLVIVLNKFDLLMTDNKHDISECMNEVGLPLLRLVKEAAQKSLGNRRDNIKGVLPLSATDDYLFSQLFPPVLRAAAN